MYAKHRHEDVDQSPSPPFSFPIPYSRPILPSCHRGNTSYQACYIEFQTGLDAVNKVSNVSRASPCEIGKFRGKLFWPQVGLFSGGEWKKFSKTKRGKYFVVSFWKKVCSFPRLESFREFLDVDFRTIYQRKEEKRLMRKYRSIGEFVLLVSIRKNSCENRI